MDLQKWRLEPWSFLINRHRCFQNGHVILSQNEKYSDIQITLPLIKTVYKIRLQSENLRRTCGNMFLIFES